MLRTIRQRMKGKNDQQGFTLVELIIVIAILGILAGLAVPKVGNIVDEAEKKANDANIRMIEEACDLYEANNEAVPLSPGEIKDEPTHVLITEGYLKEAPKDPRDNKSNYTIIEKNNQWIAEPVTNAEESTGSI